MVKTRGIGFEVLEAKGRLCIVKSKCVRVDENGKMYGHVLRFYDVCEFERGEIGDCFESFKTMKEAEKCMMEMEGRI